jgi:Hemerythrin HHE cation binding domain
MVQQTKIWTSDDVVRFLREQPEQMKAQFTTLLSLTGASRKKAFMVLCCLVALHEAVEDEIVHPAVLRALPGSEPMVEELRREEREANDMLTELETLDVDSPAFETKIRKLQGTMFTHAACEETDELDRMADAFTERELKEVGAAFEFVESIAPQRPRIDFEQTVQDFSVGPFAAIVDRTRAALRTKG